ncbi:MAG: helix-turn-helix transcriptional regulator [Proteobacteria bacterium]|nr:helix-turn-helix transcriptional regulator [Pseudomonadota bacterium]
MPSPAPEPRFAKVAAMIGDPTRARMLAALMGGQYLAAGELAAAAGIGASAASAHIAKLIDAELVVLRSQGRHRYLRLADAEVAKVLEALSFVAERSAHDDKWARGAYRPLKAARTCYSHVAGELGVALFEGLLVRETLVPSGGHYALSSRGRDELAALGVALPQGDDATDTRRFAHACFDWSERRDHLAGSLAVALFELGLERDWLRRTAGSRALQLTPPGAQALEPWLGAAAQRSARAACHCA